MNFLGTIGSVRIWNPVPAHWATAEAKSPMPNIAVAPDPFHLAQGFASEYPNQTPSETVEKVLYWRKYHS
jgi:hypothetical protein